MSKILCPVRENALKDPKKIAIFTDEKCYTFFDLEQKIEEIQSRIQERPGTKILLQNEDKIELICQMFACLRKGLPICIIDPKLTDSEKDLTADRLQAKPLSLKSRKPGLLSKELDLYGPSIFLKTSGTTAEPKLAALTLYAIREHALSCVPLEPSDRWNLRLAIHHVAGLMIIFRTFFQNAALICSQDIFAHEPTHLSLVPTQLYRNIEETFPPSLKKIFIGGSAISPELLEKANTKNLPIVLTYSMTENCSIILQSENSIVYQNKIYLGFPDHPQRIKLSPSREILIQGPTLFSGYWKENQVDKKLIDGWFATKDLGIYHPQFGYAIVGRKDRQFISGGENIQPEEIERVLRHHPKISQAYILPKKDPEFGNIPVAIIVTKTDLDLQSYLSRHLPHYKHPKFFITEPKLHEKPSRHTLELIIRNFFLKKMTDR